MIWGYHYFWKHPHEFAIEIHPSSKTSSLISSIKTLLGNFGVPAKIRAYENPGRLKKTLYSSRGVPVRGGPGWPYQWFLGFLKKSVVRKLTMGAMAWGGDFCWNIFLKRPFAPDGVAFRSRKLIWDTPKKMGLGKRWLLLKNGQFLVSISSIFLNKHSHLKNDGC